MDEQYDDRLDDNEAYDAEVQAIAQGNHSEIHVAISPVKIIMDDCVAELKGKKGKGKAVEKKTAAKTKNSKSQAEPKQEVDNAVDEERFLMQAELDKLELKLGDSMFDEPACDRAATSCMADDDDHIRFQGALVDLK